MVVFYLIGAHVIVVVLFLLNCINPSQSSVLAS